MRCRPGVRPGGRPTFFAPPKKVGKERRPHWPWPCGQPAMLGRGAALPNSLCSLRSRRSNSGSESEHEAHMLRCAPAPRPALLGTARRGFEFLTRAIAALGPGLISAAASRDGFCSLFLSLSLSLWERVGVRAAQLKKRSCPRLSHRAFKLFLGRALLPALNASAGTSARPTTAWLGRRYCSLSVWVRAGVKASQFKNRSCSRLPHKRWRCICLESIGRRRRVGACTHAFARVLAKQFTTARPAPRWPAQRARPA